jgi:hypothetical protein
VFRVAETLTVERSRTSSGIVEHRKAGDALEVILDPPLDGPRRLTFEITGPVGEGGHARIAPSRTVLGPDDGFYPRLPGGLWGRSVVTVRVPPGWTAVAPGRLDAAGEGSWRWRSASPVRSLAVAAGRGWTISEGKAVQVPLRWIGAGPGMEPARMAALFDDPMAWLAGALAPYPFDGFTVVRVGAFEGRVRASGMVVVGDDHPLHGPADAADVLAGQWFGERVAADGAWIDALEAWQGATYARDRALPLPADLARRRREYFALPRAADVPLALATADTPLAVRRGKGSAVPDMIRLVTGDRAFFRAVVSLFGDGEEADPSSLLTVASLRAALEQAAGVPLAKPMREWFERADVPEYEATMRTFPASGGGTRVDLTVVQRRALYHLPVEVRFLGAGAEHVETLQIEEERTSLVYVLPFEPSRVEVDPHGRLFRWGDRAGAP